MLIASRYEGRPQSAGLSSSRLASEPWRSWARLHKMVQALLSAIAELVFSAAAKAIIKLFDLEYAFELVSGLVGLSFIVIGVGALWLDH